MRYLEVRDEIVEAAALFFMLLLGFCFYFAVKAVEDSCPLSPGDKVSVDGVNGVVAVIERGGAWTSNCTVGVRWENGEATSVKAWKIAGEGQWTE